MGLFDFFRKHKKQETSELVHQNFTENNHDINNTTNYKPNGRPINTPTIAGWAESYESKLPVGLQAAGWYIQKYFQDRNISHPEFRWIQTKLAYPAFQHLCFAYKGNIYSVLMEFVDEEYNYVLDRDIRNQIEECKQNDLIPCTILLKYDNYEPVIDGNHLIRTDTRSEILFNDRKGNIPMSKWEINSFGVDIVRQQLEKEGKKILSFCDVLGVEPQLWYEDEYGKKCYVIVKTISATSSENLKYQVNHELLMRLINYDGYFAEVQIAPSGPGYDKNGNLVPLSEHFDFENPKALPFRDQEFYVNYAGLRYIEKQAAEKGVTSSPIVDLRNDPE